MRFMMVIPLSSRFQHSRRPADEDTGSLRYAKKSNAPSQSTKNLREQELLANRADSRIFSNPDTTCC